MSREIIIFFRNRSTISILYRKPRKFTPTIFIVEKKGTTVINYVCFWEKSRSVTFSDFLTHPDTLWGPLLRRV